MYQKVGRIGLIGLTLKWWLAWLTTSEQWMIRWTAVGYGKGLKRKWLICSSHQGVIRTPRGIWTSAWWWMNDNAWPKVWSVDIYFVTRECYSGAEGGCWWDRHTLELSMRNRQRVFWTLNAAIRYEREVLLPEIEQTLNAGRRELSSVLSNGRYTTLVSRMWVFTQQPHFQEPQHEPTYE